VIATAYKETINQAVKKYHEDGGLEVLAIKGLEVSKPVEQVKLPDYASYKVTRELYRQHSKTDSLLIQGLALSRVHSGARRRYAKTCGIEHCGLALVGDARSWNQSPDPALRQTFARLSSALH
jgi:Arylmalonate decarboxylase